MGFKHLKVFSSNSAVTTMLLLVLHVLFASSFAFRPVEDICKHHTGRRIYVDAGESGTLTAENVTGTKGTWPPLPIGRGLTPFNNTKLTTHQQCSVELITCPSCVISLVFRRLDLKNQCRGDNYVMDSPCRCDYVWISEPPYDHLPGQQYCGVVQGSLPSDSSMNYETRGRTLRVALFYSENHRQTFVLDFIAKKNQQLIAGSPHDRSKSTGYIKSPFFPSRYPRDLSMEYLLTCSNASNCRIRIIFTDFQLAPVSFLEFFDGATQRMLISNGASFRPPVIISSGPSLLLRFYANGGSNLGFKATYSFVTEALAVTAVKPSTDCGGFVEDFGGAITMMNMVMDSSVQSYDCVWLIRPPENFLHLKTHMFLKVATFSDFAGSTELEIHEGLTTEQPILETLRYPVSQLQFQTSREHVLPVTTGFYVRLKGMFNSASRLAISYAAFSYNKCFPNTEYLCANHRCIPGKLSCDSFDHCGDNSDEPDSCYREWASNLGSRMLYSQTPNYFFPKTDQYADLKTATVVFLVSSFGLIVLISALIILLYRANSRARQQRELQSHLQTISELLDSARIEEITPDEPPVYEAPPDYEDTMKATPTAASSRRKKRIARPPSRRSRSSPGERRRTPHSLPILEVALPAERPRRNLRPPRSRRPSAVSIGSTTSQNLPDSPPPPYSPTCSEQFRLLVTPRHVSSNTENGQLSDITMGPEVPVPTTWCVTAVTSSPMSAVSENSTIDQRRTHQRSLSCGDQRELTQSKIRLTQSNPLTPTASPLQDRSNTSRHSASCRSASCQSTPHSTQTTPTTDLDVYLFSSLDSAELNSGIIKSKDFFDWEEFDRQFPGKVGTLKNAAKVADAIKKYDALVFSRQVVDDCDCNGACGCANVSGGSRDRDHIVDVWGD